MVSTVPPPFPSIKGSFSLLDLESLEKLVQTNNQTSTQNGCLSVVGRLLAGLSVKIWKSPKSFLGVKWSMFRALPLLALLVGWPHWVADDNLRLMVREFLLGDLLRLVWSSWCEKWFNLAYVKVITSFQRLKWPQTKMHTISDTIFGHSISFSFTWCDPFCLEMEVSDWLLKNVNQCESGFLS